MKWTRQLRTAASEGPKFDKLVALKDDLNE